MVEQRCVRMMAVELHHKHTNTNIVDMTGPCQRSQVTSWVHSHERLYFLIEGGHFCNTAYHSDINNKE